MSTFLEKNKKKSALAALLLFGRTRKTEIALLLLAALASSVFLSPSRILHRFPGGKSDYRDLLAAFRAAKAGKDGWAAFMGGKAAGVAGAGSLDFVQGSRKDLGDVEPPTAIFAPAPESGALNPWAFSEEDMYGEREGLVRTAFAGGFADVSNLSGGAFANRGFFGPGPSAAGGTLGDVLSGGLEGIEASTGKAAPIQDAKPGRLSASKAARISVRAGKGVAGARALGGRRALVQLAAGRGWSAISVAPNCTPGTGCPGEFASTNTGVVYDGNATSGAHADILTVPAIDGISSPNLPGTGIADGYLREAEKMDADARKCRELDDTYGPQELAYDRQQEALSKQFSAMGCGIGGCSKSKANACKKMGEQMKSLCRASMGVRCRHIGECPLTAKNNCSAAECDGPARDKAKIIETNDGTRTETKD